MKFASLIFYFYPIYHRFYIILFISLLFIVSKVSCYEKNLYLSNIQNNLILPGILLKNQSFIDNPGFYKISTNTLKENQWYKIVAHYPSSVKIFFEFHSWV